MATRVDARAGRAARALAASGPPDECLIPHSRRTFCLAIGFFRSTVGTVKLLRTIEAGPDPSSCFSIERRTLALPGTGRANTAHRALTEPPVAHSTLPNGTSSTLGDLVLLTAALDEPDTDLHDALIVFADNLAAAVPSFLGVTITLALDGVIVTLSAHETDRAHTPEASLRVPFSALVPDVMDGTMMFYAADEGAFADLAAFVPRSAGVCVQVPPGEQMTSPRPGYSLRLSGLAEFCTRNQAIGVLIDQGYTPDEARIELSRRATRDEATLDDTAQDTVNHLAVTTNRAEAARAGTG
jgi:hypothetical protein